MHSLKIGILMIMLAVMITAAQPAMAEARTISVNELPPAIVLVQDKNSKILLRHNFIFDNGMLIPGDTGVDGDFYVPVPEK